MPVPRTNFRAGDRVRGAEWFHEIAGVIGTGVQANLVTGDGWAAQDLLVRFDRPVAIFEDAPPQRTFYHSAHNFEFVDGALETMREMEANSDHDDDPSRLQSVSTQGSFAVDTEGDLADGARRMEVAPCQNKMLTVAALRAVIGHFEPDELAEAKLALERARLEREDNRRICKLMRYTSELEHEREELQDQRDEIRERITDAQECLAQACIGATPIQHVRDARRILVGALSDLESDDPDAGEPV